VAEKVIEVVIVIVFACVDVDVDVFADASARDLVGVDRYIRQPHPSCPQPVLRPQLGVRRSSDGLRTGGRDE
jgi:hypothetical protein